MGGEKHIEVEGVLPEESGRKRTGRGVDEYWLERWGEAMYAIIKYGDRTESQIVGNSNQGITK